MASRSLKEEGRAIGSSKPLVPKRAAGLILDSPRLHGKDVSVSMLRLCDQGYKRGCQADGPRGAMVDRDSA
jgi:hypothetical protein